MQSEKPLSGATIPVGWFLRLWRDVKTNVLSSDLKFLRVTRGKGGTVVSLNIQAVRESITIGGGESSGDSYNGMCKAINTSDNTFQKIKIVDGADTEASNCGKFNVNKFMADVVSDEFTITEPCFIYLESVLIADPATSAVVVLKQSSSYPEYEDGYARQVVSRVGFEDGKITYHSQEPISQFMHVIGEC